MKKIISILLTVALILSLTPFGTLNVFAADITEPIEVTSRERVLDEGVNVNVIDAKEAVSVKGSSSSIKVNGYVSLVQNDLSLSDISGVMVNAASADITGDISVKSVELAQGIYISGSSGYSSGDVYVESPGTINVGGNVSVDSQGVACGIKANPGIVNAIIGKDVVAKGNESTGVFLSIASGKITVNGNVISDTNLYDDDGNIKTMRGDSIGVLLESTKITEADIKGNIISNGKGAAGVILGNYSDGEVLSFNAEKDIIVKSTARVDPYFDINNGIMLYNNRRGDILKGI